VSALFDKFLIPTAVGLVVIGLATAAGWLYQRRRTTPTPPRVLRRYSLLGTTGADGTPLYYESTLSPGSVVTAGSAACPNASS